MKRSFAEIYLWCVEWDQQISDIKQKFEMTKEVLLLIKNSLQSDLNG